MNKKFKKSLKQTVWIFCFLIAFLLFISLVMKLFQEMDEGLFDSKNKIPKRVLQYEETIKTYSKKYNVNEHVPLIMAIMIQESSGKGNDPMQASESYCGSRNCIKDPTISIEQGIRYFHQNLKAANGDVDLAIQSYNFGKGFIEYVQNKNTNYSLDTAIAFSQKKYKEVENPKKYRCNRKESKELNACYGDIYYVKAVRDHEHQILEED